MVGYLNQFPACYIPYIFEFGLYFMQLFCDVGQNTEHRFKLEKYQKSNFLYVVYTQ